MKKLVSILMAAVLLLCAVPVLAEGQTYTVGVCQLVTHDALDAATQGFIDALTEELGDAVTFAVQNAAGDSNTCSTIVNSFVAADVDLILANATAALQAAVAATADIPILGTSVTEYGVALDIDDFTGRPPWCKPSSPTPRTWACSTARLKPTASIRWIPSRDTWRRWATPALSTPLPTAMMPLR